MAARASKGIMRGIKVLDMTQVIAGPSATSLLAEMADITKIELAPTGDRYRFFIQAKNRGTAFVRLNRGKKSICMNFRTAEARQIVRELIPKFDVLVENFAPGVMARMGLDYESVRPLNPRIIMCSISAFGQTGPLSSQPGFDYLGAAYAGVLDVMGGEPDGSPTLAGVAIGDYLTGMTAMAGIGCALFYRAQTGEGQHLEASLLDSYFYTQDQAVVRQALTGGKFKPGNGWAGTIVHCARKGSSKGKSIGCASWFRWTKCGANCASRWTSPNWRAIPDFATNAKRLEHRDQVLKLVQDWLDATPEDEALRRLQENRVPVAPVLKPRKRSRIPICERAAPCRRSTIRCWAKLTCPGSPWVLGVSRSAGHGSAPVGPA